MMETSLEKMMSDFKQYFTKFRLAEKERHTKEKEAMMIKQIEKLIGDKDD